MRMYPRYFIINSIVWDDIVMTVNLNSFLGYVSCVTVGIGYGIGKKYAAVAPVDYSKAIMWEAIGQGICIMGIATSKGSVALFLLRIVVGRRHIVLLWFCIISTPILCIITTTLLFLQYRPTSFLWDHTIEGGVCWLNFTNVGLTMGGKCELTTYSYKADDIPAWSAAMDFVLAILPWHVVMGLNIKRKEKLTIAIGLSLRVFAGVCSFIRTYEDQSLSSFYEYVYDTVGTLL
ncbi:hypothetical protein BCR34DRAFT_598717 [Clohesyomyces aquaticus]|uniref:Rhodopsin domain-containing protein n=1 Tax=Clohesyomyces aquaticus TaxID=1231657 RepID=A0A1Y1ZXN2_9PLEO|nr:hypothetical protein BCR34DRAFT_598717 [Clohesyomyces aquaticus]